MKSNLLAVVGLVLSLNAVWASAAVLNLSSRDYLTPGDGLLTFDSSTNLEWLDLSYTTGGGKGISIRQGEALPFFDGVGTNGKFRWATESEIRHLLANVPFAAGLPQYGLRIVSDIDAISDALSFVNLLGDTNGSATDHFAVGVSRGYPSFGRFYGGGILGMSAQTATTVAVAGTISEYFNNIKVDEDSSDSRRGLWFVRSANPVPLPNPALMLGVALGVLGVLRRREAKISVTSAVLTNRLRALS